nr:J domain-containing protein [uncultured Oscillibacter sp.]
MSWPWDALGLSGPADLRSIRRAYAQRLKTAHPEEDPEGFQRLHAAYQEASRYARQAARTTPAEPEAPPRPVPPLQDPGGPEEEEGRGHSGPPQDREEPPRQAQEDAQGPEWDYDELLGDRERPAAEGGAPSSADWDYERLFAEGEAEAREARRRKLEELRQKNRSRYAAQQQARRQQAAEEEESWSAVLTAVHTVELLYASGASPSVWRRFLGAPAFLSVRANIDLVFALEDFLEQHPDLSPEIRREIFLAYEAQNASKYPMYARLYRLLDVSRGDKRRMARSKSAWRNAWRSYPPWRKAVIAVCSSILAAFALLAVGLSVRDTYRDLQEKESAQRWEAQSLAWLEEDLGEPFLRPLGGEDYRHIFAPASDPSLYFWVQKDGERSGDWPGYRTDYPHIRIMRAMEDFAEERGLGLRFDSAGGFGGGIGEAPGAYLIDLPLLGAEEAVAALGELVEEAEAQRWYRVFEDRYGGKIEYQIFLCHKGLSFYDAISTQDGGFDAQTALDRYRQAGCAFCRYILEDSGLAARHMGEDAYLLQDQGAVEIGGGTFFHVSGLDKESSAPKAHYLLAAGGGTLFCLPEGRLDAVGGIADLYRGSTSHLQLDSVGLVIVLDQIQTG